MGKENKWIPGDPWAICDLSGIKVRMSQTRKTWDGLRVAEQWWYPKHPQLSVKAIPDHMAVQDARPRPTDVFTWPAYGTGPWTLSSPNGNIWTVTVANGGVMSPATAPFQPEPPPLYLGGYLISISNAGALSTSASTYDGPGTWIMYSPNGTKYQIKTPAGVITVTLG